MSSPPVSRLAEPRPTPDAAQTTYLHRVRAALTAATRHSADVREATTSGLPESDLDRAGRLEALVDDLVASGGKMIRPQAVYLGHAAVAAEGHPASCPCSAASTAQATPPDDLVRLGSALELLHVFGLLQDDVMDEADTRRGTPTAHRVLRRRHRRAGLCGDGARFGESLAILAGDLAFALAQRQVRGLPSTVTDAWDHAVVELVQGQRLDLLYAVQGRYDAATTERVAMAKSGAYSVVRPLELGALLARPQAPPPAWLTRFGNRVGQAFALADDILGIWGDPRLTGKPVGDDITARKPSTVLGIADVVLDGRVGELLRPDGPTPTPGQVGELMTLMRWHGVFEEATRRLHAHLDAAHAELEHVPCPPVHAELSRFAHRLATRHE